jgi:hypothetical protein
VLEPGKRHRLIDYLVTRSIPGGLSDLSRRRPGRTPGER